MPCTTILVGKHASFDGSTMIARNDDSGSGHFMPKKFVVIHPEEQKRTYQSVISHVTVELPENPMRYTAMPNAIEGKGIWAACGVNEVNVAMTATETLPIIPESWEPIHWWNMSRNRMDRKNRLEESGKRILSVWCFPIFTVHARAWSVLEAFSKNTEPMR